MNSIVVANWKMHGSQKLIQEFHTLCPRNGVDTIVCPPACYLPFWSSSQILLGAQNCHQSTHGAFTGEISVSQLIDLGCQYVILGHSERRLQAHETDDQINAKATLAISHGITPIICIGESLEARKEHRFQQALLSQLDRSTAGLNKREYVVAYEPIWSIGTGLVPTNTEILKVFELIQNRLNADTPIIYGGSVTDKNAATLRNIPGLNGVLVGGASLNVQTFQVIVDAFQS